MSVPIPKEIAQTLAAELPWAGGNMKTISPPPNTLQLVQARNVFGIGPPMLGFATVVKSAIWLSAALVVPHAARTIKPPLG